MTGLWSLKLTLVMILLLKSNAASSQSQVFEKLDWTEIRPAAIHAESILADEPMGRPVVDVSTNEIWITGKSFLWRWSLTDGSLVRLEQPVARTESFNLIHVKSGVLIGVDKKSAWILKGEKQTWRKLDGSFPAACIPLGASPLPYDNSHRVYFMNNCGIFLVLVDPGQLLKSTGSDLEVQGGQSKLFAGLEHDGAVLTTKDHQLLKLLMDGPRVRQSEVYRAKSKLKGVVRSGKYFIAWSSQALIFFDEKLRRKQVIPVLGSRKIDSFGASADRHVLAFADGAIEVMDITTRRKQASGKGEYSPNFIDVFPDGELIVLSSEAGIPRVFKLSAGIRVTPAQ